MVTAQPHEKFNLLLYFESSQVPTAMAKNIEVILDLQYNHLILLFYHNLNTHAVSKTHILDHLRMADGGKKKSGWWCQSNVIIVIGKLDTFDGSIFSTILSTYSWKIAMCSFALITFNI